MNGLFGGGGGGGGGCCCDCILWILILCCCCGGGGNPCVGGGGGGGCCGCICDILPILLIYAVAAASRHFQAKKDAKLHPFFIKNFIALFFSLNTWQHLALASSFQPKFLASFSFGRAMAG
jgi:hypothetical protein